MLEDFYNRDFDALDGEEDDWKLFPCERINSVTFLKFICSYNRILDI